MHCYQLKGGDITLARWRTELKPEVEAMLDLPPKHPTLKRSVDWVCHLAVNGEFRGEAMREVVDTQRAREARGQKSFDVITRGALLSAFSAVYGSYLPRELDDFTAFIDMYRADGLEPIDKAALARLLESFLGRALDEDTKPPAKNAVRQQINAAVVSVSYLLANKYKQQNHIAILEGWLLLLGYIMAAAEKNDLNERYWLSTTQLIEQIVDETVHDLLDELEVREHFAQPASVPYADAYVYRLRVTIIAGYLAGYAIFRLLKGDPSPLSTRIGRFIDRVIDLELLTIMGSEGQIPLITNVALYYQLYGNRRKAAELLGTCMDAIIASRDKGGMYDPYVERYSRVLPAKPVEFEGGDDPDDGREFG